MSNACRTNCWQRGARSIGTLLSLVVLGACSSQAATLTPTFKPQVSATPTKVIAGITQPTQAPPTTATQATVLQASPATQTKVTAVQPFTATPQAVTTTRQRTTPTATIASTFYGVGVVTKINPAFPSIELNHEEIKGYMPAMTMEYFVKDKSLLQGISVGERVAFTIHDQGSTPVIMEIKPQK